MNNNTPKSPFYFIEYDKISDVLMWFNSNYYLKLNVKLSRNDKNSNRIPFHSEYKSYSKVNDYETYMIRREYNVFYSIESNIKDIKNNYIYFNPGDVYVLNMLINNIIIPWFFGDSRIFGKNKDDELCIKNRNFSRVNLPVNGGQYISFLPTIIKFNDGNAIEGISICINSDEIFFDITADRFFNFAQIISNTDMISTATSMLNYVKSKPYLVNYKDFTNEN
jgi:hypothetical protein